MRKMDMRLPLLLLLVLSILLGTSICSAETRYPCDGTIKKNDVNVREKASTRSDIVHRFGRNESVTVLGKEEAGNTIWYLVEFGKGKSGYVRGDLIELEEFLPVVSVERISDDLQRVSLGNGYAISIPTGLIEVDEEDYSSFNAVAMEFSTELFEGGLQPLYIAEDEENQSGIFIIKCDMNCDFSLTKLEGILEIIIDEIKDEADDNPDLDKLTEFGELLSYVSGNLNDENGFLMYYRWNCKVKSDEINNNIELPISINVFNDKQPAIYIFLLIGYTDDEVNTIMNNLEFDKRLFADVFSPSDAGLYILDHSGDVSGNYVTVTGRVKNEGDYTFTYIRIKAIFKDENGEILDTNWTYAVGGEGLEPLESKTFSIFVPYNEDISQYEMEIVDFDM